MSENIIEIVNNDVVIEIESTSYDLVADNIFVSDYNYTQNKPEINSVQLLGNKSAEDLGLVAAEDMDFKEDVSNKVVSISGESDDNQYPSAKCVYDNLGLKADANNVYSKAEEDTLFGAKANTDLSNLSLQGQAVIDAKANANNVYSKTESDNKYYLATNPEGYIGSETLSSYYTKTEIDNKAQIKAAYLKTVYKSGTSGYMIWSNGYCIQWGRGAKGTSSSVTLSKTFSDTNYSVTLTNYAVSANAWGANIISLATNKITVRSGAEGTLAYTWIATGQLASGQY